MEWIQSFIHSAVVLTNSVSDRYQSDYKVYSSYLSYSSHFCGGWQLHLPTAFALALVIVTIALNGAAGRLAFHVLIGQLFGGQGRIPLSP